MEVLATFVREHSHEEWMDPGDPEELRDPPEPSARPPSFPQLLEYVLTDRIGRAIDILSLQNVDAPPRMRRGRADDPRRRVRPDIQAALTVIGRRNPGHDRVPVNLGLASLIRANLIRAHLPGAILNGANLERANLDGADLTGAYLSLAKLIGATVEHTDLSDAILTGANFARARDLDRAILAGADLTGALWPADATVPKGWHRGTTLGRLKRANTDPGSAADLNG